MLKYKVGDKVRVRQWDAMKREYGVNENGDIRAPSGFLIFTSGMKHLCGESVIVEACEANSELFCRHGIDDYPWWISEDVIEGYAFEYGEEIEIKYYDDWNKRIFVGYVDGVDKPYICVDKLSEDDFKKGNVFDTSFWKHARPIQK